ncbi:MAG: peptide ABC transporter substrate-binding protein [Clostridia bacterium]|nr:peptide ABC transporter substrate-binding protein [Clostridia bacterium]
MKRILALVLCLLMLVPMMASCGEKDENDKGAIIQMYLATDVFNFDPIYAYTDDAASRIMGMIYEGLFQINPDNGKVENALCKKWEIVEDPEDNVYKARVTINDTAWSDGRKVSVDDVIYAWKRLLDPEFSHPAAAMLFEIKNAKAYKNGDCSPDDVGLYAVDTTVMEIQFEQPIDYDLFKERLCAPVLVPVREDAVGKLDKWASNVAVMVSNGPFRISSFRPGEAMVLQRNTYYYRDEEKDKLDVSVKPYRIYIDLTKNAEEQYQLTGDTVFFNSELPLSVRATLGKKDFKYVDSGSVHTYYFNTNNELFADANVRKALSLALDRQAIADIVVFADPATGLIDDSVYNTSRKNSFRKEGGELIATSANVAEAEALLNEAGVRSGSFTITIRDNAVDYAIAEYAKGVWEELGFRVSINALGSESGYTPKKDPITEYDYFVDEFETAFNNGDFDVAGIDLQMFSTDAFGTLAQYAVGFSGTAIDLGNPDDWYEKPGITGYNSDEYNQYINEAYEAIDRKTKTEKLHQAEEVLMNDMPVMPLLFMKNAYTSGKKLSKFTFDYYGCPQFAKAKLKNYEDYTNVGK